MIIYLIDLLFTIFTFMLLGRVLGSWFPRIAQSRFMRFLAFYTDPYLNLFRKIIPPIGMVDISPIFAFLALQLFQVFIIKILS